ncbi:hypothetical protein [Lactiplantibacillus pentosus]|uniref:Integral membrane protein n=3 Tax=Lactiplantibacillus pentosus TaxID=1589 RepID=A0AAX6LCC3_LACPE|nr:hypothetical protein [Lactiplantibacillus pentosus]AYG37047.1 hypothetical protein CFK27_03440 [Lactiplantibacillus pentosus]AYG39703.1 hypothetical protein CFI14_00580 [Lactiplantibacillus pentosus]AYJ41627.1 hypothetical protein LP314_06870 [Lactiplantibacillus pentosus]KRK26311.1 hypothetical protein FD24_GL002039 [Lactiplantibacillus pentosus DSM 20314]MBU7497825.1 hypothetical protein [Lactiplantibacillus pentosus]
MKKLAMLVGADYIRCALFTIIAVYAVTASPTGQFKFHWTLVNGYLLSAYFVAHPLLMALVPKLTRHPFQLISAASKSLHQTTGNHQSLTEIYRNALNPVISRDMLLAKNDYQDDLMGITVAFIIHGCLQLLAWPLVIIIGTSRGIHYLWKVKIR